MAIGYYGVKLSGNVIETPEGYLVFKNAVIARTGFYIYKGSELLKDEVTAQELAEQGVTVDPNADVNVYRSPEEVFSKQSIDSYQAKPVTNGHPSKMLDIDDVAEHECGQVFNVRAGTEPLEDGNMPLLGDIIVKDSSLIEKWKAGLRELSCGYNYHIIKSGDNLLQVDIIGNHVAFVENGRAGQYARVNDSQPRMEKRNMKDFLKDIRKRGFLAWATDAKPAEVAAAMDEMAETEKSKADDTAMDAKAKARDKFHKALDKHLDAKDAAAEEQAEADDADMEELKGLFSGKDTAANEVESEEETAATDAAAEEEESEKEAESEDEEAEAEDEAVQSEASPVIPVADRTKPDVPAAVDAAYRAGAESVLKAFKPFVARAKNKALTGAFDTTSKLIKGTGWKGSASYAKVAKAAGAANDAARESINSGEKLAQDATTAYAEARTKALTRK